MMGIGDNVVSNDDGSKVLEAKVADKVGIKKKNKLNKSSIDIISDEEEARESLLTNMKQIEKD